MEKKSPPNPEEKKGAESEHRITKREKGEVSAVPPKGQGSIRRKDKKIDVEKKHLFARETFYPQQILMIGLEDEGAAERTEEKRMHRGSVTKEVITERIGEWGSGKVSNSGT